MRKWKPHNYQLRAMKWLLEHACAALWLDPGMGKTSVSLGAFKVLLKQRVARRALVIAPLRPCHLVWPKELEEWEDFNSLRMVVLHGAKKDELIEQDADIYVINPDGLQWLLSRRIIGYDNKNHPVYSKKTRLQELEIDTLIVDEVTKFKHTNTARFKALRPVLHTFARRWTLTGTPVPNGFLDLFGQIYIADTGNSLGQYITHYRNAYFDPTGYGGYTWLLRKGADKEIIKKLKPIVLRLDGADYLEMPKFLPNPIYVDMPQSARNIYNDMEEQMIAVLNGGEVVTALSAAAASNKCRQVANGGLYTQDQSAELIRKLKPGPREWVDLHCAKIDAVLDLVEEIGGKPVFIAYDFKHDLARLRAAFGKDVPVLGGKGSTAAGIKHDLALQDAWNANKVPVMLGHPAAIGHGLNLQKSECQDIIMHSDTWDLELYDQFRRRIGRQGSIYKHIRVHHIIARNTIDEALYETHDLKGSVQQRLMASLRRYVRPSKAKSASKS